MSKKLFKHSSAYAKVLCCLAFLMMYGAPALSQQIITDGNTQTTLNTVGAVTDVNTGTVVNSNAFNSFTRFNVDAGNTVNLHVPDNVANLINIVRGETSNINGILESFQNGVKSGNIYLVNPHGIVVGQTGNINVGSLTAVTSTQAFADGFFTSPGNPNTASVQALLDGTLPVNPDAVITIDGQINAIDNITFQAGTINNTGLIMTDAEYPEDPGGEIAIGDIVNLNSIENALNRNYGNLWLENGEITFVATHTINQSGEIYAGAEARLIAEDINLGGEEASSFTGVRNGDLTILATNNILAQNSIVDSYNNVIIGQFAPDTNGVQLINSVIYGEQGVNIQADHINSFATPESFIEPEIGSDGNITIQTYGTNIENLILDQTSINTQGTVQITATDLNESEMNGIIIQNSSEIIGAMGLNITTNANIQTVGQVLLFAPEGNAEIHANKIILGLPDDDSGTALWGQSLNLYGQSEIIVNNSALRSRDDLNIYAGDYVKVIQDSAIISDEGNISIGSLSAPLQRLDIYSIDNPWDDTDGSPMIQAYSGNIDIEADDILITGKTEISGQDVSISGLKIDLGTSVVEFGAVLDLFDNQIMDAVPQAFIDMDPEVTINSNNLTINPVNNLNLYNTTIYNTNLLTINGGDISENGIIFIPQNINTGEFQSDFLTPGADLELASAESLFIGNLNHINIGDTPFAVNDILLDSAQEVFIKGEIVANGNVTLTGNNVILEDGCIYGSNIWIEPDSYLEINDMGITTPGQLTLFSGNIDENGIFFWPELIDAGTLSSDFLFQNQPFNLAGNSAESKNIIIGNLDEIQIGGAPLNPTSISILYPENSIEFGGCISTEGDITLHGDVVRLSEGYLTGDNIILNPLSMLEIEDSNINANSSLTVNTGNVNQSGIVFNPDSINTPVWNSDLIHQNADLLIFSQNSVRLGNFDSVYINENPLNLTNLFIGTPATINIAGESTISDQVLLQGGTVWFDEGTILQSSGDMGIVFRKNLIINESTLISDATMTINQLIQEGENIYDIIFAPELIQANVLNSNLIVNVADLFINATNTVDIMNLNNIVIGDVPLTLNNIIINADSVFLGDNTTVNNSIFLTGNVASLEGEVTAGNDITLMVNEEGYYGPHIENDSIINAGNDLILFNNIPDSNVEVESGSTLTAGNKIQLTSMGGVNILNDVNMEATSIDIIAMGGVLIDNYSSLTASEEIQIINGSNAVAGEIFFNYGASLVSDKNVNIISPLGSIGMLGTNITAGENLMLVSLGYIEIGIDSNLYSPGEVHILQPGIPFYSNDIDISENSTIIGDTGVTIQANGDFWNNGLVSSDNEILVQNTFGNIMTDVAAPVFVASDIGIAAEYGQIGDCDYPIYTDLTASSLNLLAFGNIFLTENTGDMEIVSAETKSGDLNLTAIDGNILFTPELLGETIIGGNITLNAPQGSIGLFEQPIAITMDEYGVLNIQAGGYININAPFSDITIGVISNNGLSDVKLNAETGSILAVEGNNNIADIITRGLELYTGIGEESQIGTMETPIKIDTNYNSEGGSVIALSGRDIALNEVNGDLLIHTISNAGNGDVFIQAEGSILDATPVWEPNIYSNNLTLISDNGTIGNLLDGIDVAVNNNLLDGVLNAQAEGIIHINQLINGVDLSIGRVHSNSGDVELSNNAGIIPAPLQMPGAVHISGNNIYLEVNDDGTIGTADSTLTVKLNNGGALTALTTGIINITAPLGNLNVHRIISIDGNDVILSASNSILSSNPIEQIIAGGNITLDPYISGSIGTFDTPITIDTMNNGVLTATSADGYINITEGAGDLIVNLVSNNGKADVKLSAPNGGIMGVESENPHILAHSLELYAGIGANNTIGTENQALHINANADGATDGTLTALAGGLIVIRETQGDLNLNVVSNAGNNDVVLIADGSILNPISETHINIYGNNIALAALNGSIGQNEGNYVNLALNNNLLGGVFNAIAESDILVFQQINYSNLAVDEVISNTGSVALSSNASIIDAHDGPEVNVSGENITLWALHGSIGTYDNDFDIRLNGDGKLLAVGQFINLHTPEGDMVIDGIYNSGEYDIKLVSAGNILAKDTPLITNIIGKGIYFYAPDGDIGTINLVNDFLEPESILINTNLDGVVTAIANGDIALNEMQGNLNINVVSNAGKADIYLACGEGSIIDANTGETPNIYGNNIQLVAYNGIGTMQDGIDLALNNNLLGGTLFATAWNGDINLNQMINGVNMNVGAVTAVNGDVKLSSNSGIIDGLDVDQGDVTNITANNITLVAVNNSSIGTFDKDLDIDIRNGGSLTAFGYGYIGMEEVLGDLKVNVVSNAGRADVQLQAQGSIIGNDTDADPEVISRGVTLISDLGNIGEADNTFDVDTNYAGGNGTVTALAYGLIGIYESNGNMLVNAISNAGRDEVFVWAKDSILDGSVLEQANIFGKDIIIESETGSIGTIADKVDVYTNYNTLGGALYAFTPQGSLYINQIAKNLYLGEIEASNIAAISATAGGIYTYTGYPEVNITSAKLFMESPVSIGNQYKPIIVDVSGPIGAGSPSVYIRNVH